MDSLASWYFSSSGKAENRHVDLPLPPSVPLSACASELNKQDFQHREQESHSAVLLWFPGRFCTYVTPQCIISTPVLSSMEVGTKKSLMYCSILD